MRKALGLMAVLLVLGIAAFGWCANTVYEPHDQVQFTQTVLAGDPAAAKGLSVQTHATLGNQLFWDCATLLQGDALSITQTEYRFFNTKQEQEETEQSYAGIELFSGLDSSSDFLDIPESQYTGLDRAYRELYNSAVPGQESKKTITVANYYDYYPLAGYISLQGIHYDFGIWSQADPGYDVSIQNKLEEYFRIPVLPNEKLTISLEKDSAGTVISSGTSADEGDQFSFYTQGVVTPQTVYFSFYNRTSQNNMVDTSLIPGGYGIYAMDYTAGTVQQRGNLTQTLENGSLHLDSLRLAYPIDPKEEFLDLCQWSDGKTLLLYTREDNTYYLTVISMDTMQRVQRLKIQTIANSYLVNNMVLENQSFLVTVIGKTATVLLPNGDGTFRIDMQTPNTLDYQQMRFFDGEAMDYRDGKLALVYGADGSDMETLDYTGFDVVILNQDGLQFWARYKSSLQNDLTGGYNTDEIVRLLYNHPVEVTWK